jgi:hypothetical protein
LRWASSGIETEIVDTSGSAHNGGGVGRFDIMDVKMNVRMALYELRSCTLHVGKMAEGVKLYQELSFAALQKAIWED